MDLSHICTICDDRNQWLYFPPSRSLHIQQKNKKTVDHRRDVKRKPPRPVANAPSIDVFHAYDEQPGPSAGNYIRDPEYPAEAPFKMKTGIFV